VHRAVYRVVHTAVYRVAQSSVSVVDRVHMELHTSHDHATNGSTEISVVFCLFAWGIVFFLLPSRSSCQKQYTSWLVWFWLHHFLALMLVQLV